MIKKLISLSLLVALTCNSCKNQQESLADYVDTSIGVVDRRGSNCVIGPQLPYGSINPSPHTRNGSMDGYNPDMPIRGFAQLHVSGTGWSSYGHFLISPMTGLETGLSNHDSEHSADVSKAYYYSTFLDRYGIKVEIAPSYYSAIYRFTFPETDAAAIVLDASHSIMDIATEMTGEALDTEAVVDPETGRVRMRVRFSGGWPEQPYDVYLVGQFDHRISDTGDWTSEGHDGAWCTFDTRKDNTVLLKLAVSFTGYDTAQHLLDQEIPDWNFDKVVKAGSLAWDNKLSAISVETDSADLKTIFYSALYRTMTLAHDRSKDNSKWETEIPFWDDNYAYWDTFRSAFPLLTLVDRDVLRDNILAMIDRFEHNGCVYDGFVAGTEKHSEQGGNNVDVIIADAFVRDIPGIDWEKAYAIVKHNADNRRIGHKSDDSGHHLLYKELGWIPECVMSTSQTLEFAYNDYCAGLMAQGLGHIEDAERYFSRSHGWVNLWNPDLEDHGYRGYVDARRPDGSFAYVSPTEYGGSWVSPFYEADAWTYNYYAPHDFDRLIELMGGDSLFVERLQFGLEHRLPQFSNEPGFLVPRAFAHAGRPDLESYWVHQVMKREFDLTGYPGNEDTGSMGSWYVFCSLGLYPNAGQDIYYLNAPLFKESRIRLADGKCLTITADKAGSAVRIKSAELNGKKIESPYIIRYADIKDGGQLTMELY